MAKTDDLVYTCIIPSLKEDNIKPMNFFVTINNPWDRIQMKYIFYNTNEIFNINNGNYTIQIPVLQYNTKA